MNTFVIMLDKIPGREVSKDTVSRHIEHLRKLNNDGSLVLCGPFTDYPSGMVVIKTKDKNRAVEMAEMDPFVKEGARTYSIRSWLLANEENNFLG